MNTFKIEIYLQMVLSLYSLSAYKELMCTMFLITGIPYKHIVN